MQSIPKKDLGSYGESAAAEFLTKNGYEILETNFSNELGYRRGEIDIVAKDCETSELVFAEVKTIKKNPYSKNPESAITPRKYKRLQKAISIFINKHRLHACDYRLDAISIEIDPATGNSDIRHLKYIYY